MKVIRKIAEMQGYALGMRREGRRIGIVPTMGYLHEGHMSLVDEARRRAEVVVVTIFVNPAQFGVNEDLSRYPRDFERDSAMCEGRGVDVIFAPEVGEMYPDGYSTWVEEEVLSQGLCGESRPGHFRGVATVVAKLFNAVLPDVAVFGQKDAQQYLVLRRMVRDLNFPVEMVSSPIVRESDGLAMSSRNKYLSVEERAAALTISRSLREVSERVSGGGAVLLNSIAGEVALKIEQSGGRVDYVRVLDAESLCEPDAETRRLLIAVAAYYGKTRLIDNMLVGC